MTEKRFTIENDIEMKDNWNINKRCYHFGNGFDAKDCCNMLNELQEENKRLKSINQANCDYIGDFEDDFIRLAEENKELKQEIKGFEGCSHNWGILYDEAKNKVEELSKENQELKYHLNRTEKELKEYKDFMSLG